MTDWFILKIGDHVAATNWVAFFVTLFLFYGVMSFVGDMLSLVVRVVRQWL